MTNPPELATSQHSPSGVYRPILRQMPYSLGREVAALWVYYLRPLLDPMDSWPRPGHGASG